MTALKRPNVYFDANVLIELGKQKLNKHLPSRENDLWYFTQMLRASQLGEMRLFTSSLSIAECVHLDGDYDVDTQAFFSGVLLSGSMVTLVQSSVFVAEYARDLRWKHKLLLKPIDSLHVASALDAGCTEFLTWDTDMSKPTRAAQISKLRELKLNVIAPQQTGSLPLHYTQQSMDPQFATAKTDSLPN